MQSDWHMTGLIVDFENAIQLRPFVPRNTLVFKFHNKQTDDSSTNLLHAPIPCFSNFWDAYLHPLDVAIVTL